MTGVLDDDDIQLPARTSIASEVPAGFSSSKRKGAAAMNESARQLGGRLPLADPATLTPTQRELYDQLIGSWVVFTVDAILSDLNTSRVRGPATR